MRAPLNTTWTEDRVDLLKKLWSEGLSASQIAGRLGQGVSRNAVIGKVHRLGLAGRKTTVQTERVYCAPSKPIPLPKTAKFARPVIPTEPTSKRLSIVTVKNGQCRWPHGNPGAVDFHLCGARVKESSVYCAFHCGLAYQPPPERRPRIAP
jgi:GcrA cell cycle regulator